MKKLIINSHYACNKVSPVKNQMRRAYTGGIGLFQGISICTGKDVQDSVYKHQGYLSPL